MGTDCRRSTCRHDCTFSIARGRSVVTSVSVRVCVFVRDQIFGTTPPIFTKFCVRVTYDHGLVILWRRNDMLCTSGFTDDVMFAHKPIKLLDVAAQLKRSAHAALGLTINCARVIPVAGQRTHGTTFRALKVTSHVATPGAESAVYHCLVNLCSPLCGRDRHRRLNASKAVGGQAALKPEASEILHGIMSPYGVDTLTPLAI